MNIKTNLIPTTWFPYTIQHGYGNGYVGVPPEHPWFNQAYESIDCSVHGGLTYGEDHVPGKEPDGYWWVGFDTNHLGDTKYNCPQQYVEHQIENLKNQAFKVLNEQL